MTLAEWRREVTFRLERGETSFEIERPTDAVFCRFCRDWVKDEFVHVHICGTFV